MFPANLVLTKALTHKQCRRVRGFHSAMATSSWSTLPNSMEWTRASLKVC